MSANVDVNNRPDYDQVIQDIADYVMNFKVESQEALDTARNCLMDTLGCGLLAKRRRRQPSRITTSCPSMTFKRIINCPTL